MNRRRRETIIREIEYWKRSRLLPEHYCNYLLALYTEGDASLSPRRPLRSRLEASLCLLLPAAALAIYFTELSFVLQTLLCALFSLFACFFAGGGGTNENFFTFRSSEALGFCSWHPCWRLTAFSRGKRVR